MGTMAHVTFVARALDGVILTETWDETEKITSHVKSQAKQLLRKLHNMPNRCSVEDSHERYVYHFTINDGVCILAVFDRSYPKNLAFAFLEEVAKLFQEELKREFGTGAVDYRSHIETIEKPYYFIRFDRQITNKRKEYMDPTSSKALTRINENLIEVSSIMKRNISEILHRGEHIDEVGRKGDELRHASQGFRDTTKMLSYQSMLAKYGIPAVLVLVVFLVVYIKFLR